MHNETKIDYNAHSNDWSSYHTFMLQHGSTNMAFMVPLSHNCYTYFVILSLYLLPLDTIPLTKNKDIPNAWICIHNPCYSSDYIWSNHYLSMTYKMVWAMRCDHGQVIACNTNSYHTSTYGLTKILLLDHDNKVSICTVSEDICLVLSSIWVLLKIS